MLFDLPKVKRGLIPFKRWRISLEGAGERSSQADEQPLRDELYSVDQLNRHARSLAGWHEIVVGRRRSSDRLLRRLSANAALLNEAYGLVTDAVARGRRVTPAAEWFLDNYHLIEEQVRTARRHLPRGYSRELPQLSNGPHAGYPRAYAIALELISHVDGRVDAESLHAFVASYQLVTPLRLGELWAIPIMLRLALLENLRRVVVRVVQGRRDRERAAYWVDRMLEVAAKAPAEVVVVLSEMVKENPPLSAAFVSEFASRMQGQGSALIFPTTWLEHRVAEQGQTIETVFQQASQSQAADQVSIGNSIGSLRFLGAMEWRDFVEAMSAVEQTLRTDPAGVYPAMDFATRDYYRHAVEEIAKNSPLGEIDVAHRAIELATGNNGRARDNGSPAENRQSHVGYFLVGAGRRKLERAAALRGAPAMLLRRLGRRIPLPIYAGSIVTMTALVTALVLRWAQHRGLAHWSLILLGILLFVGASQLAVGMINWAVMLLVRPRILSRLDFSKGIPPEHRTIVAVPAMITDDQEIDDLVEALEVRFLANRDANLSFALLSDFSDAAEEKTARDEALLQRARDGIEELNTKYETGNFFLLHRSRRWNARENVWMGWERKRGKLEEFNEALRGQRGHFQTVVGPAERLQGMRYVITLDSDTQLPRDSARQLVGTLAHPLNRPRYDQKVGRVTEGYGILQPRVGISMPSATRSRYARLFAGDAGLDPYTRVVSDVYQDLFGEGSFIGKGIYDVDVFRQAVAGRLPENRVLSHDLLEGAYARSGLVSDVLLFEEHPSSYPADVSRRYRWIRGDWQIAPWLLPRVPAADGRRVSNPLSALSKWKILDNIRRSLVPVAMLALLVCGWFLPGAALLCTLVVIAILVGPAILNAAAQSTRRPADLPVVYHLRMLANSAGRQVLQQSFVLACLPYDAFVSLEAIGRTAIRVLITGSQLLEWRTAREAQRAARADIFGFYSSMWALPVAAAIPLVFFRVLPPGALKVAAPIIALWFAAPAIVFWVSQTAKPRQPRLTEEDVEFLRKVARRTWRFFEVFVAPDDNYLPPDNFQEDPPTGVAHRTSPTNIGLSLLANLTAHDFGYITIADLIERTSRTLASLDKLQRYRGHFYNWYDTRTLEPLRPLYVSSVDSGNLAGHLLTLAIGLDELASQKIFRPAVSAGLGSAIDLLLEVAHQRDRAAQNQAIVPLERLRTQMRIPPSTLSDSHALLQQLDSVIGDLISASEPNPDAELKWWMQAIERQVRSFTEELSKLTPWVGSVKPTDLGQFGEVGELLRQLDSAPTLADVAQLEATLIAAIDKTSGGSGSTGELSKLRSMAIAASEMAAKLISELQQLAGRCRELADIDYAFLYHPDRHLLSIGYNVADHRLDAGFYDLLASEARLGSFVAIAQGKLPQEHWFSLGRSLTNAGEGMALLSWSGSMFEYLMPLLVMPTFAHTLLDETYFAVVRRQIEYGRERGVPWGISESGYTKTDAQGNYQYQAFGVPGLGFKRGLGNDLVIAPYASAMALMVDAEAACANLQRLAAEDRLSAYGFYEAVDYGQARLPRGQQSATVQSYMAHHQGMAFLSFAYVLLDRPMQRRFESDPAFRATDLLLQERVPKSPSVFPHPAEVSQAPGVSAEAAANYRVFTTPQTPVPEVHLLSNSRYHVAVTAAGGGFSRWRDLAVTRWKEDSTRDCWGTFCYLRDVESGEFWSAAHQPTNKRAASYEAIYSQGRAEFRRRDGDIATHLEISVSPEDDIELRRISITNRGRHPRTIELTSYAEVVLAPAAADAAHPAFSNLFVQTQLVRERQAILCTRRARSAGERPPWMLHLMAVHGTAASSASYETARAEFVGRGGTLADPAAMHRATLSDSEGSVLDPIVAIRNTIVVGPDETVRLHLVTGAAETHEAALALIEKYHDRHLADRVFELAWTHSQVVLRQLDAAEADTQLYGRLASSILYANPLLRAPGSVISRNLRGQSGLWAYGISGDLPIVLLRIGDQEQINLVRQLVQAHAYWRMHGLAVDLVIWNEDQSGYRQLLQEKITGVITSRSESGLLDKPGGIFIRRLEQISDEDKVLMQSVARVIISDTAGTLAEQMERRAGLEVPVPRLRPVRSSRSDIPLGVEIISHDLAAFNGTGGFTHDGREYVIVTTPESRTPAPWVNVIANPWFGTVVSESGSAYTWCENAHSFRLTPWNNDAVGDASGEAFYIRDEETGRFWSPSPLPARGPMRYTTRHGFGYSVFEYAEDGISTEMRTFVATDAPVKFVAIKVSNVSGRARRLSATGFFELVLGDRRESHAPHIVTEVDPKTGALLARNPYNSEFAQRVVFLDSSETKRTVTGDRGEFLGRNGTLASPACMGRTRLSGRLGAGIDPCAAMQATIDLTEGQTREIVFIFGTGRDLADTRNLVARFRGVGAARLALEGVWAFWNRTLGALHVETPDASVNFLANGWLLYQVLASRVWGRSGFYQSGGAFGFRDQLQDVMSLVHAQPAILREQILRCAAHQFREGDVQHWWHPPQGRGVRTRISDDYLWLPFATCRYVAALGDTGVLDEKVNFLEGRPVQPQEDSYYDLPARSEESATIYEHCVRAIKHGLRFGEHGLPLMGTGDWNDGMNLVGEHGKGESVWLAFFLHDVLVQFTELAKRRQDEAIANLCISEAEKLRANIEAHGWDGEWYRRAYFDSGEPLGSTSNPECRIDSIPQSWSVLSHAADPERSRLAMAAVDRLLVNRDVGVIKLFEPPFDKSQLNPGYVKGYVPGVRENGGQYTHAAIWAVMAFVAAGDRERAWELFQLINPIRHGDSEAAIRKYKVEPYVVAADVYANPQHAGRGGWTWYTGSAAWMYRLITESFLGLRLEVDQLRFTPCIPADWQTFKLHYRYRETFYHITFHNLGGGKTIKRLTADGAEQADGILKLKDDRQEHFVEVDID
ncbi:MAG TPA: glucoamylase family protein [Humisphaera sp.]|nr:glucoamylase family protein [Humisphaera sp.]